MSGGGGEHVADLLALGFQRSRKQGRDVQAISNQCLKDRPVRPGVKAGEEKLLALRRQVQDMTFIDNVQIIAKPACESGDVVDISVQQQRLESGTDQLIPGLGIGWAKDVEDGGIHHFVSRFERVAPRRRWRDPVQELACLLFLVSTFC